jgi:hypothetical protein
MGWVMAGDKPADGATVAVAGPTNRTAITDGSGFYGLVDLPPGAYRVTTGKTTLPVTIRAGIVTTLTLSVER